MLLERKWNKLLTLFLISDIFSVIDYNIFVILMPLQNFRTQWKPILGQKLKLNQKSERKKTDLQSILFVWCKLVSQDMRLAICKVKFHFCNIWAWHLQKNKILVPTRNNTLSIMGGRDNNFKVFTMLSQDFVATPFIFSIYPLFEK